MKFLSTHILFVMLCISVLATISCAEVPPIEPPPLDERLQDLRFQEFGDALGTGTVPPEMASYRNNPSSALGALFAKVAKADKTCTSPEANDFVLVRITPVSMASCAAETSGPTEFEERIVKGGVEARISYVVGEVGTKDDYAFEFYITNPIVALYPASQECVEVSKIASIPPPERTCDVLFVTGATLTQATYRQYVEIQANIKYNAVVNIEGKAYGTSSSMQSRQLLTVDFITLGNWFAHDAEGFLQAQTATAAASMAGEMQELTPEAFTEAVSLTREQKVQLREISLGNLLAD